MEKWVADTNGLSWSSTTGKALERAKASDRTQIVCVQIIFVRYAPVSSQYPWRGGQIVFYARLYAHR